MLTRSQIDELEKLTGQLNSIHSELSLLVKKSPNDGVNDFKIKFINEIIKKSNSFFGKSNRPLDEFEKFDIDELPTNSDITFVTSHYIQAVEKIRSDNIYYDFNEGQWLYHIKGGGEDISTSPPKKLKK